MDGAEEPRNSGFAQIRAVERPGPAAGAGRAPAGAAAAGPGSGPGSAVGGLLALVVTAANISDKTGAKLLLIKLFDAFSMLRLMWVDTGYNGEPLEKYARVVAAIAAEIAART